MDRDYYDDVTEIVKDTGRDRFVRVMYSTFIYVITYFIITYLHHYAKGLVSLIFEYDIRIDYHGVHGLPIAPNLWTKWGVLFIFSVGPIIALFFGLICLQINAYLRESNTIVKVYALWFAVHGVAMFCSFCITSSFGTGNYNTPFYEGFAVVASWLHLDTTLMIPVTVLGILIMIGYGLIIIVAFLSLSFSRKLAINKSGRNKFLFQVLILPWIIGSVICVVASLPPNMQMRDFMIHFFRNACIIFLLMGILFRLDYIVGSIQVHSFDVFKNSLLLSTILLVIISTFVLWKHFSGLI